MANSDERRFAVLRAIVADYVSNQEPVASKAIVDRHNLGVSSATVRNDMASLEEDGYITQPHTSAGRIPTDKGYRLFVDRLSDVKPLSGPSAGPSGRSSRARSTSTTCMRRSVRHAGPADQAGRGHPVPDADPLHGPPHRAGPAHARPHHAGADHRQRPRRAAHGRPRRRDHRGNGGAAAEDVEHHTRRPSVDRGRRQGQRTARRRTVGPAGRHDQARDHADRVAGRTPGGAAGPRRYGQPHPQRRGLPRLAAPGARGARGAGGGAEAVRRREHAWHHYRADRGGERGSRDAQYLGRLHRLRSAADTARRHGCRRADQDGLPGHDRGGARGRQLRGDILSGR